VRASLVNAAVFSALSLFVTSARTEPLAKWSDVLDLGATFSVYSYGQAPYNRSAPFLTLDDRKRFSKGSAAFTSHLVRDTHALSGLAPTANANAQSCESCHFMDGRGRAHATDLEVTGLSVVNRKDDEGRQIFRIPNPADSKAAQLSGVKWAVANRIALVGGEVVELVRPVAIVNGVEQPVDLRNAPGVYGLGLLEAIPEADIVTRARAQSYVRFGVAGILPVATDAAGSARLGRFGWKGSHATLPDQVRSAVTKELGILNIGHIGSRAEGASFADLVADLTTYLRLLAVPARRLGAQRGYRGGARLFDEIGCAMCHTPAWQTGNAPDLDEKYRNLRIFPFTDMLLHDMGPSLSDPSGSELSRHWRTAPLWGIGVQHGVARDFGFLHDGRARTLVEAILWHDGEARHSVDRFTELSPEERADLVSFLNSL
jgi:CxxC motif-containing protein (DUF1111 family)